MIRLTSQDIIYLIPLAFIGMLLHQVSFFTGLQTIDATTSSLILSLFPIFTALLARLFLKEPFTLRMVVGSLVALIGVFFVVSQGRGTVN
ncbi:DMT family transporter [Paenibacillus xylanilyticus]|uniref:DMT family transporter n=1 Tax=Paenibacillus xylanilyticus TaxID=248903 RepID=UPI001FE984D9|nr:DMT family transporter [Paenibacillus xylanilyticus]